MNIESVAQRDPTQRESRASLEGCLIVAGMHRSGTSLTAALLQAAGIDIGADLLAPHSDNPKGYFEDQNFLDFHSEILRDHKETIFCCRRLKVTPEHRETARRLLCDREGMWGWKDPRTTLFLDFWKSLFPDAKFLFVYRDAIAVVDSLFRRATDEILRTHPVMATKAWLHYNACLIDFTARHQSDCLVVPLETVVKDPADLVRLINRKWQFELQEAHEEFESLFDESLLLQQVPRSHIRAHLAVMPYRPRISRIQDTLRRFSHETSFVA